MATMQIHGSAQIKSGTITNTEINASAAIATSKLADGANFIQRDGSVAFTAAQSMGGFKITSLGTPTAGSDAATKLYVDNALEGLRPKEAVRVASTANVVIASALEAGDSIDGITLVAGDRVLLKDQTAGEENGIYIASATGAASRSTDFDSLSPVDEINKAYVAVQEGTANAGKLFVQYGTVATLDTDPINFTFFNSVSGLTGGDGIAISGSNVAVDHDGEGLQIVSTQLALEIDGSTLSKSASGIKVADGGITNTQVNAAAAIAYSKLDLANSIIAGDLTSNSVTTAKINNSAVDETKIAASVAGDGLTGGAGTALAVGAGTGIAVAANTVSVDGSVLTDSRFIVGETPAGTVDDVNDEYVLAGTPQAGTVAVYRNGVRQKLTTHYTIVTDTITMNEPPLTGDFILCDYLAD